MNKMLPFYSNWYLQVDDMMAVGIQHNDHCWHRTLNFYKRWTSHRPQYQPLFPWHSGPESCTVTPSGSFRVSSPRPALHNAIALQAQRCEPLACVRSVAAPAPVAILQNLLSPVNQSWTWTDTEDYSTDDAKLVGCVGMRKKELNHRSLAMMRLTHGNHILDMWLTNTPCVAS